MLMYWGMYLFVPVSQRCCSAPVYKYAAAASSSCGLHMESSFLECLFNSRMASKEFTVRDFHTMKVWWLDHEMPRRIRDGVTGLTPAFVRSCFSRAIVC